MPAVSSVVTSGVIMHRYSPRAAAGSIMNSGQMKTKEFLETLPGFGSPAAASGVERVPRPPQGQQPNQVLLRSFLRPLRGVDTATQGDCRAGTAFRRRPREQHPSTGIVAGPIGCDPIGLGREHRDRAVGQRVGPAPTRFSPWSPYLTTSWWRSP